MLRTSLKIGKGRKKKGRGKGRKKERKKVLGKCCTLVQFSHATHAHKISKADSAFFFLRNCKAIQKGIEKKGNGTSEFCVAVLVSRYNKSGYLLITNFTKRFFTFSCF